MLTLFDAAAESDAPTLLELSLVGVDDVERSCIGLATTNIIAATAPSHSDLRANVDNGSRPSGCKKASGRERSLTSRESGWLADAVSPYSMRDGTRLTVASMAPLRGRIETSRKG